MFYSYSDWFIYIACVSWTILLKIFSQFIICDDWKTRRWFLGDVIFPFFALLFYYGTQNISHFIPAYSLFFSALIVTIYTDLQHMLISRFVSLYLIPLAIFLSYMKYLPITPFESIIGATLGYSFFYCMNKLFYLAKKHDGLGQGDLDLIAFIGAFTGPLGCWISILFGSILGTLSSALYMLLHRKTISVLPFGPFLACGALCFVIFESSIFNFLINRLA